MTEESDNLFKIEATVTTGFEEVAQAEAEEKLHARVTHETGRICIYCPIEKVPQILELGCVNNCLAVIYRTDDFKFSDNKIDNLQRLRNLVGKVPWPLGLRVWKKIFSFEHPIAEVPENITENFGEVTIPPPRQVTKPSGQSQKRSKWKRRQEEKRLKLEKNRAANDYGDKDEPLSARHTSGNGGEGDNPCPTLEGGGTDNCTASVEVGKDADDKIADIEVEKPVKPPPNPWDPLKPSFRVTCNRYGDNHNFDSMTAASNFGGAVYQYFGWNVKMKNFDIEVILNIDGQTVEVCIGLTKESLHRRNIEHFGPTTLRPTVAYCMLRLCDIQQGDVVCDPMCGTGSIPLQAALSWPNAYHLAGEIAKKSIIRTADNVTFNTELREKEGKSRPCVDTVRWDVCNLPLRDQCVDVFITDLPFGLRMGSKLDNWRLYPGALIEMARVVRPETGRVCLLTQDKKCMIKTLMSMGKYWRRAATLGINLGGLAAGVFVLQRTAFPCVRGTTVTVTKEEVAMETNEKLAP